MTSPISPLVLGEKLETDQDKIDLDTMKLVISSMLKAGYHELRDDAMIENWMVTFEEPIMKQFFDHYQIKTFVEDIQSSFIPREEFMINPRFRRSVLEMFMKCVANSLVASEMETPDDWYDVKFWS